MDKSRNEKIFMDYFHSICNIYCYCSFKWSESNGRNRWFSRRNICNNCSNTRYFHVGFRKHHIFDTVLDEAWWGRTDLHFQVLWASIVVNFWLCSCLLILLPAVLYFVLFCFCCQINRKGSPPICGSFVGRIVGSWTLAPHLFGLIPVCVDPLVSARLWVVIEGSFKPW